MTNIKYILLVFLFQQNLTQDILCPKENHTFLQITWPEQSTIECVLSDPPCIDKNMELRRRCCTKTGWEKEPDCEDIQPEFTLEQCPPNTILVYENYEGGEICFGKFIECPYDDIISSDYENFDSNITYSATRNVTNGIDIFRYSGYSTNYKLPFEKIVSNILDIRKNCIFATERIPQELSYETISCSEKREKSCYYTQMAKYITDLKSYCSQKMGKASSGYYYFQSEYNVLSKCFVVENNSTGSAELFHPYQRSLIQQRYTENLLFGLRKINETYYWNESKIKINYTDWSHDEQFISEEATYGLWTNSGWTLVSSINSELRLNQYELIINEPSLDLVLQLDVLYLKVTNYNDLKLFSDGYNPSQNRVYCFTDAELSSIIFRYNNKNAEVLIKKSSDNNYYLTPLQNAPGKYWCEAIKYATLDIITSNTIYYTKDEWFGNVYISSFIYTYTDADNVLTTQFITLFKSIFDTNLHAGTYSVNFKKIDSIDTVNNKVKVVLEFIRNSSSAVVDHTVLQHNYDELLLDLKSISQNNNMEIVEFSNFDYCVGEVPNEVNDIKLNWPDVVGKSNEIMRPIEVAITIFGELLNVKCVQDYYLGAKWEPITQDFYIESQTDITPDLINLMNENYTPEEIIDKLNVIIDTNIDEITPLDMHVISEVLDFIQNLEDIPLNSTIKVTDKIASVKREVLFESQLKFNTTDRILTSLDGIYVKLSYANNGATEKSNGVLFATFDLSQNNISAVTVEIIDNQYTLKIYNNESSMDFENNDDFIGAMLLDKHLANQIVEFFKNKKPPQLIVVVYINDSFFNPEDPVKATVNVIFDVLIPDFFEEFVTPITIVYKVSNTFYNKQACSFWNFYKYDPDFSTNKGDWLKESYTKSNSDSHLVTCNFWHVTHFTLLILENPNAISATHQNILDKITLVNCIFSGTGLVAILVTAVIFKKWRSNKGNHILINFSVAIALQITLLYVSDFTQGQNRHDVSCIIVGAALHYSVIAEFSWMLLIAYLQYKRLVDVFTVRTKHIVFKSYLIGWLIPITPVGYLLIIDSNSYLDSDTGLCYPSGIQLYITVWFPVAVVVAINATIYCFIFYSLLMKKTEIDTQNDDFLLQIRLALLLFVMLGLTWIFGFLSLVQSGLIFVYIFAFLSTLQGFVLFLFFIVLNKKTRNMYFDFIHNKKL